MIRFEIMREKCLFLPSSFPGELKVTNSALGLPAKHPLLFAALNKVRTVVMMIMMIVMVIIFISSDRSSSVYHGLLHTRSATHPLFQIFQILQIRK